MELRKYNFIRKTSSTDSIINYYTSRYKYEHIIEHLITYCISDKNSNLLLLTTDEILENSQKEIKEVTKNILYLNKKLEPIDSIAKLKDLPPSKVIINPFPIYCTEQVILNLRSLPTKHTYFLIVSLNGWYDKIFYDVQRRLSGCKIIESQIADSNSILIRNIDTNNKDNDLKFGVPINIGNIDSIIRDIKIDFINE